MALFSSAKAPRCFSCLWKSLQSDTPSLFSPIQLQVRGKRRLPRRTTITVRLLDNVRAYGSKGTILSIAPARMRNQLYPRAQAAYMTVAEIRQAEADELVMERDASYGIAKPVEAKQERQIVYDMETITPQRAREMLEKIVPEIIEFQRKPISQDASDELGSFIYGSVSSLDILTAITASLARKSREAGFEDANKVVLSAHDIQVSTEGLASTIAETERIKSLGEFKITVNIKNAQPLERKIKVLPLRTEVS